jgi:hypothetical protein
MTLESRLNGKTAKEKASLKGRELAKVAKGQYERSQYKIEIADINEIEGGVEVFARAWRDGKQIGFGDGTVDIERFRIFNPPVLVDDPNGKIVRQWEEDNLDGTKEQKSRTLREDPQEAILRVIEHNLTVMKNIHDDKRIVRGKRGNTTSTFYPAAGANSPVDGAVFRELNSTWSGIRDNAAGTNANTTATDYIIAQMSDSNNNTNFWQITRGVLTFDTSVISTDTISSATISVKGTSKIDSLNATPDLDVVSVSLASTSTIATGDYDAFGTTVFSSISYGSFSTTGYNNLSLDENGISNINTSGVSQFGFRLDNDTDDTDPGIVADGQFSESYFKINFADETGTTSDPKLVVEHEAAPTGSTSNFFLVF